MPVKTSSSSRLSIEGSPRLNFQGSPKSGAGCCGCCWSCMAFAVVVRWWSSLAKESQAMLPLPSLRMSRKKECLPNLFILATAYKPPTSLPCLDATESTGYLTACMSSVASVSALLPCFVDGGQGTKQKGRLLLESRPFAVRALDGSLLAESKPIWCCYIAQNNTIWQAQFWAKRGKTA